MRSEEQEERQSGPVRVRMYRVASSAIEAIGYNPHDATMHVKFRQTGTYTYRDVPPDVFRAFLAARSKGRFYNQYIRNSFIAWSRLRPGETPQGVEYDEVGEQPG